MISIQQCTPVRNFSHFVGLQIMGPNLPKIMTGKNFEKNKHWNRNKHVAMYACTKFQLIWRT